MQSTVAPEVLQENRMTIHQFLRETYAHANQHWQGGVSFFKQEFSALHKNTLRHVNRMLNPVNNFLKDKSRIENELHLELNKEPEKHLVIQGKAIPVKEALKGPLEENY